MQCCALVLAAYRKQQTPQLWMEGTGEGCGFFCSPKLPYLRTMSQQFCRRLKDHILYRFLETLQTGYSPFLNSKCCLCTCFIELLSIFLVPNYLPFNDFVGGCSFFITRVLHTAEAVYEVCFQLLVYGFKLIFSLKNWAHLKNERVLLYFYETRLPFEPELVFIFKKKL